MELAAFHTRSVDMVRLQIVDIYAPAEDVDRIMEHVCDVDPLAQGVKYDSNAYQSAEGVERYRPLKGAAAGAEKTVRMRPGVVRVSFELPDDPELLAKVVETIFQVHSYQEPVIRVHHILSSRSRGLDDSSNPYRWWNASGDWKRTVRMRKEHTLKDLDMPAAMLEREWVVTVDTPLGGVDVVRGALGRELPLVQGPYDNCMFVRETGYQTFRALEGAHAGAEGTVQKTPAAQIVFSLPCDIDLLRHAFAVIFAHHVNEEPTIRVVEAWGSRSKLRDDKDNPHRYWNRADADVLHGRAIEGGE